MASLHSDYHATTCLRSSSENEENNWNWNNDNTSILWMEGQLAGGRKMGIALRYFAVKNNNIPLCICHLQDF